MAEFIKTVGQGLLRPNYEELPIDVHQNKLLDWLVDRKKTPADWYRRSVVIGDKVTELQEDLSRTGAENLDEFLPPTKLNYFDVVQLVDKLKQTDGAVNMFNQYTSERLKNWIQVQRAYEKDGVYLGEAANLLLQYVQYDIPAVKRQIANWQQQLKDLTRKDSDAVNNAAAYKAKFVAQCNELKISGANIRSELTQLVLELPSVYAGVEKALRASEMDVVIDYYKGFLEFTIPTLNNQDPIWKTQNLLPLLMFMREHGNTPASMFTKNELSEWTLVSEVTPPIEEQFAIVSSHVLPQPSGEPTGEVPDNQTQINWDVDSANDAEPSINWDIDESESSEVTSAHDASSADDTINNAVITIEDVGSVVQQDRILDRDMLRNQLIDDILELRAFLAQRYSEQTGRSDALSMQQFQNAIHLHQTAESLKQQLHQVEQVLELLRNPRTQQLFLLKSSPRYLTRLTESLEQKMRMSETLLARLSANEAKRTQINNRINEASKRIATLSTEARVLRSKIEGALSKVFSNRIVNIIGEISS